MPRRRPIATAPTVVEIAITKSNHGSARAPIPSGHAWFAELGGPQWSLVALATSHWPMLSAPEEVATALNRISAPASRSS
jgi:hypothetical protein